MLTKVPSHGQPLAPIVLPHPLSNAEPRRPFSRGLGLAIFAVLLAAYANFNFVWNQFYRDTPMLFDTAWYAHLVHRSSPLLQNPPTVTFDTIGPNFYATHLSPLLWVFSWPTYVLPVSPELWVALLEAAKYALLALVVGLGVRSLLAGREALSPAQKASAAAVVLLAPFNGIVLASIAYPHFEGWFIVGALGFLFVLYQKRTRAAAVIFAATLLLREDMGFHLCGLLVVTALAAWWVRGHWDREIGRWAAFAAAGFLWSVAAMALMRIYFPGDDAFSRVYLGTPPFAHLTGAEILNRVIAHAQTRAFFWLPLAVFLVWAMVRRSWWVLLGYAAFLPWITVNFIARSQAAATLALYYSFPLGVALLWPVVGHPVFARPGERFGFGWFAAALLLSIIGYLPIRSEPPQLEWRAMLYPVTSTARNLEATADAIAGAADQGEVIAIDDGVAGLAPARFVAKTLLGMGQQKIGLAAFYSNGRLLQVSWEKTTHLPFRYRVKGTHLIVLAKASLAWPQLDLISSSAGSIAPMLHGETLDLAWTPPRAGRPLRVVAQGPKLYFPAGEATATFKLSIDRAQASADDAVLCEVVAGQQDGQVIAAHSFPLSALGAGASTVEGAITFVIPEDQGAGVQLRVRAPSGSAGRVVDVILKTSLPAGEIAVMTEGSATP
ncbi:MAG: hypothetical protein ABIY47_08225 [Opitutaceae bacterium]